MPTQQTKQIDIQAFQASIREGIPDILPDAKWADRSLHPKGRASHAPNRDVSFLSAKERKLALKNALRYFDPKHHAELAPEFAKELDTYGRIYMYRFCPTEFEMKARNIEHYPARCKQAAAIMLMIQNNLDNKVAKHPIELITYGGNGAVFQNWAQYRLTMQYLSEMTEEQTLAMYSGHPMGLFPSHKEAPRAVVTNGMMIPNHSSPRDWNKYNALGVTQYGQMTAGSFMYIGPQGIVHGTTITVLNAGRMKIEDGNLKGKLFISSGMGGMSGAQSKAAVISEVVGLLADVDEAAIRQRIDDGYVNEEDVYQDLDALLERTKVAMQNEEAICLVYHGNIVDLWEAIAAREDIKVSLGSDQTSLHNPYKGGYYPTGISFEEANELMNTDPEAFKEKVQATIRRHITAVNTIVERDKMYFWDYGNAFLLEAKRANADVLDEEGEYIYPSYVKDIMGPMCFDYGFGPFRWVCASNDQSDLDKTDAIAAEVLEQMHQEAPEEIKQQLADNLKWVREAKANGLVVGSKARILYTDSEGRIKCAKAFNKAIRDGIISGPIVLGRDHHDVSGTDSPERETANIYDGSKYTADMAVQNVIGDSFRGATWVSLHNGGGVGWGEVINGGFGMLLDGSEEADRRLESMLFWDVNNGIARRSWARNEEAIFAIKRAMQANPQLKVTLPNITDDNLLNDLV